jgi:tRNA-uridine 2-sulfurtransferase
MTTTAHNKQRVALGMSGGVDSSVAAHILMEQGYEVTGVFLECWRAPGCRSEEDRKDALKVALSLGIPFEVLDFKQTYKDKVVENFFSEYAAGRTPNPDVLCNKEIKFGLFYEWAMKNGFDYVATGHYAQVYADNAGTSHLAIPKDEHKDQTYFLYLLNKENLEHILFPLGHLTKPEVRALATQKNIHVADKKDSVGICFIGDIDVHQFLKDRLGENPGPVVDVAGNEIGSHNGLWFYTIGQRHGFEIKNKTLINQSDGSTVEKQNIPPFYVIGKNPDKNQLVVGFGADTYFSAFTVENIHWIDQPPQTKEVLVRIRHTGKLLSGTFTDEVVTLTEAAQGIAEGQSTVFYEKNDDQLVCLGGGIISDKVFTTTH